MLGPDWAWRRRLRERRATYHAYRMGVAALGVTVVIVGLILVPLPGPGWLIVFCGLAILATEFHWPAHDYRLDGPNRVAGLSGIIGPAASRRTSRIGCK